ncbi:MAG: VWA domain-containing protein [Blastocatellia bacterium]
MVRAKISAIILAMLLPFFSVAASTSSSEEAVFTRVFSDSLRTIIIENPDGATEVQTWTAKKLSVTASRAAGGNNARLESEVSFVQSARDSLKIVTRPDSRINLIVYVPASVQLSVKGGKESVIIKGLTASLSVETSSGGVALHLPKESNTDLSLRTIQGNIESRLPVTVFGQSDIHLLDGRLGQGGAPVIARSQRGQIGLFPDDDSRLTASNKIAAELPPAGSESSLVSQNLMDRNEQNFDGKMAAKEVRFADPSLTHSDEHTVKLSTRLVSLNVKVTDNMGKPLPMLNKTDFQLLEESVPQDISHFEPVTTPLNIVLLLDLSGSTDGKIKIMKKAAKRFVDSLNLNDNIAVAAFTRRFMVISNFTTDRKLLKDRIDDIKNRHSGTAYYDAMWATLNLLDEVKATRKAVVVMTDGVDNSLDHPDDRDYDPKHSYQELMERIVEADATIYPIYLDTEYEIVVKRNDGNHDAYVTARKQLAELAEQTGAVMFKADRAEDLESVYQQVAAELHSLYSIAYTPKSLSKDGQWRRISITVNRDGAKARTRRGYFAK